MTKKRLLVLVLICTLLVGCGKKKEEYKCDDGFKLIGDQCIKEDIKDPVISPGCLEGFTYSGKSHKCEKETYEDPFFTYVCDPGFKLTNTYQCEGIEARLAKRVYLCDNGELSGSDCITKTRNDKVLICTANCEHGTRNKYNRCEDTIAPDLNKYPTNSGCPDDYTPNSKGQCYYTAESSCTYSCPDGFVLENNTCYAVNVKPASLVYQCEDGNTLVNAECRVNVIVDAKLSYYCESGKAYDTRTNKCIVTEYRDLEDMPQCDKDYVLENNKCKKTETKPAEKTS